MQKTYFTQNLFRAFCLAAQQRKFSLPKGEGFETFNIDIESAAALAQGTDWGSGWSRERVLKYYAELESDAKAAQQKAFSAVLLSQGDHASAVRSPIQYSDPDVATLSLTYGGVKGYRFSGRGSNVVSTGINKKVNEALGRGSEVSLDGDTIAQEMVGILMRRGADREKVSLLAHALSEDLGREWSMLWLGSVLKTAGGVIFEPDGWDARPLQLATRLGETELRYAKDHLKQGGFFCDGVAYYLPWKLVEVSHEVQCEDVLTGKKWVLTGKKWVLTPQGGIAL